MQLGVYAQALAAAERTDPVQWLMWPLMMSMQGSIDFIELARFLRLWPVSACVCVCSALKEAVVPLILEEPEDAVRLVDLSELNSKAHSLISVNTPPYAILNLGGCG